jgi:hypothetical protein
MGHGRDRGDDAKIMIGLMDGPVERCETDLRQGVSLVCSELVEACGLAVVLGWATSRS